MAAKSAHGFQVATPAPMQDENTVRLVKQYDRPEIRSKPEPGEKTAKLKLEVKMLQLEIAAMKDKQNRLELEIEDTIKMLTDALLEKKEETIEQVRRRISRLRGALQYRGRPDSVDLDLDR